MDFHEARKVSAWNKARPIPGYDPAVWRQDAFGDTILWSDYGKRTEFGWEIDHQLPQSKYPFLTWNMSNLRALHWKNNRSKSDRTDVLAVLGSYPH